MSVKDPNNPLFGKEWRGGRKPVRYDYTLQDISQATGRAIGTVRNDVSGGRLVMEDLVNVASYVWLMRGAGGVAA